MRWDKEPTVTRGPAEAENQPSRQEQGKPPLRGMLLALLALAVIVVSVAALVSVMRAPATSSAVSHATSSTASGAKGKTAWRDVGLSAGEQIVFSHSAPQTGYSCGVVNKTIVMHATHDGGMSWQPLPTAKPITSELCTLAVDDTNPQRLALLTRITMADPCLTNACTPTPCANACQPCIDYCPPPPQQTLALYRSTDGGGSWTRSTSLPYGVHSTLDIAFAGSTLYAWTGTWPTLLAASVADGPFRLIDLSAYYPPPPQNHSDAYQGPEHLWPLRGQLYVPTPNDVANTYIVTGDGGRSWTRRTFAMDSDPVVLRPASGLDGRTLMGERIHEIGHLVLSTDGGSTWQAAPPPYPDFTHYGQTQCFVSADGSFVWFNGFDANFGLGVYVAKPGGTAWTKLVGASQIQDISVDLVSYDAAGHLAALWGRQNRTNWVVYQLP